MGHSVREYGAPRYFSEGGLYGQWRFNVVIVRGGGVFAAGFRLFVALSRSLGGGFVGGGFVGVAAGVGSFSTTPDLGDIRLDILYLTPSIDRTPSSLFPHGWGDRIDGFGGIVKQANRYCFY